MGYSSDWGLRNVAVFSSGLSMARTQSVISPGLAPLRFDGAQIRCA